MNLDLKKSYCNSYLAWGKLQWIFTINELSFHIDLFCLELYITTFILTVFQVSVSVAIPI